VTPSSGAPDPTADPSQSGRDAAGTPQPHQIIRSWLIQWLADTLGMPASDIDPAQPFDNYGLLSRDAVGLSGDLEDLLGCKLAPTIVWEYPSIDRLSRYLTDVATNPGLAGQSPHSTASFDTSANVSTKPVTEIAIVGIGCRFPGAASVPEFWSLLREGKEAVTEVPKSRWDIDAYYDPKTGTPGKMNTRWGGFLEDVSVFDASFFGISPREAVSMDPQQRLLLEVAWEALEDAGCPPQSLAGSRTGVFVGISSSDYSFVQNRVSDKPDVYAGTGNAHSVAANRLSYFFDFHGPSVAVDTACSSSLVAIHAACRSIREGECSGAIVAGVNVILDPNVTTIFSQAKMMSPSGRCKTFDSSADGYVRSEGCGVVYLKPLDRATADGDRIYAVVRGSAVNQDGRSNGLTAPNGASQQAVIRAALSDAGVRPAQIGYVEAHGTGTPLGDPIEVDAIKAALGQDRASDETCYIASVKTNIGHLEAAAGIAGVIKAALVLHYREIPPHIQFRQLNPHIDLKETPFRIPIEVVPWRLTHNKPQNSRPQPVSRFGGISAFGFGGTNAHVILAEASTEAEVEQKASECNAARVLTISAHDADGLRRHAGAIADFVTSNPDIRAADIFRTLNAGRNHFRYRAAILFDAGECGGPSKRIAERLRTFTEAAGSKNVELGELSRTTPEGVGFLFTGQGSQYTGMARQLYDGHPVFRHVIDRCAGYLHQKFEVPLLGVLYPEDPNDHRIDQTLYTQPALYAIECGLSDLWRSWGVKPVAAMGHSVGEFAAAYTAGVFELEEGLHLIAERARLMHSLPAGGTMAAVLAPAASAFEILNGQSEVSVAGFNGPSNTVISGPAGAVSEVIRACTERGFKAKTLAVSHAFHSALMEPILDEFEQVASTIEYRTPEIALISNLTGKPFNDGETPNAAYWRKHAREAVRFSDGVESITALCKLFLEPGPSPVLCGMAKRCVTAKDVQWLPTIDKGRDNWISLAQSLAKLYVHGSALNWRSIESNRGGRIASLPTYPFERKRHWFEAGTPAPNDSQRVDDGVLDSMYRVSWEAHKDDNESSKAQCDAHWIIFAGDDEMLAVADLIAERHGKSTRTFRGPSFVAMPDGRICLDSRDRSQWSKLLGHVRAKSSARPKIIFLSGRSLHANDLVCEALAATHALIEDRESGRERANQSGWISFVTSGGQAASPDEGVSNAAHGALWGFARTLALEQAALFGGVIDLSVTEDLDQQLSALLTELESPGRLAAIRSGERLTPTLVRLSKGPLSATIEARRNATYLITGGLGDLGLATARWLVGRGAKYIALLSRRDTATADERVQREVSALIEAGASIKSIVCDVSSRDSSAAALSDLRESGFPEIAGVVHAAGLIDDHAISNLRPENIAAVFAPKVQAVEVLQDAIDCSRLDFFVMYSSAAALLGSPGQANYAAANAYLDGVASHLRSQGIPALSVNWGPWADIGMAAKTTGLHAASRAVTPLQAGEALEALGQLMASSASHACVIRADWDQIASAIPDGHILPFLSQVACKPAARTNAAPEFRASDASLTERIHSATGDERVALISEYLREKLARVLRIEPHAIPLDRSAFELGLDSIMIMELLGDIGHDFQTTIYPREVFDRPTLVTLAEYLAQEIPIGASAPLDRTRSHVAGMRPNMHPSAFPQPEKKIQGVSLLLCSPRSGSTLLRVMLAGHSKLFCPPELHLLPFVDMSDRSARLAMSHLGEGLNRALAELSADKDEAARTLEKWECDSAGVDRAYAHLAGIVSPKLLIDKSPSYGESVDILQRAEAMFESPKYVFLTRHPYAVIESIVKNRLDKLIGSIGGVSLSGLATDSYAVGEGVWSTVNANILDFLSEIDPARVKIVKYEDLVAEPERVMRELCTFYGVPFEDAVLTPYQGNRMTDGLHEQSRGIGDVNFLNHDGIEPSLGEVWRHTELPRKLGGFARRIALELGYDLPNENVFSAFRGRLPGTERPTDGIGELVKNALVPIRTHGSKLPFFLIHPAGGVVFPYYNLLPHLDPDVPVYAIQEPALKTTLQPERTLEAIAEKYVRLIQYVQPRGPYRIAGWSFGGAVAYEMVRQMYDKGIGVESLIIMDTEAPLKGAYNSHVRKGLRDSVKLWWSRAKVALSIAGETGPYIRDGLWLVFSSGASKREDRVGILNYISWAWADAMRHYFLKEAQVADVVTRNSRLMLIEQPTVRRTLHCLRRHVQALRAYKPAPSATPMTLIKAEQQSMMRRQYDDPTLGWERLAKGGVTVRVVPGNHVVLMNKGFIEHLSLAINETLECDTAGEQPLHQNPDAADGGKVVSSQGSSSGSDGSEVEVEEGRI
jgi:acyl transferase domain-containing protein/thioesterase domain-containing protein/acyl carrier protein